jgi:hypothetical protein
MWKETETGKVGFWRLWPVSEVNSKPANPFETKGNLAPNWLPFEFARGNWRRG